MPMKIHQFPCLSDNFGVLIHDEATGATAAIDAPEAHAVVAALEETSWSLTDILVTHHHADHTQGIADLKERYQCRVVAPAAERAKIPAVDVEVREGNTVTVGNLSAQVLETPGHTKGHISYWFAEDQVVFVGDTLFSIGCGRLLEGDAAMMWNSLSKLKKLPDATRVYCGHEYTESNVRFALGIEPDNAALQKRAAEVTALRAAGKATLPVTIGAEKAANPFLRADLPEVAALVGMSGRPAAEVFGEIRARKDRG